LIELLYHPAIAASVVVLVMTSYLLKRKRQYFRAHYAAGILGFSLFLIAFPVGLDVVSISGGISVFPQQLYFHFANFFLAAALLTAQGALGMSMLLTHRHRRLYAMHKRLAKYVLGVFLLQGLLGLSVLVGILPYI
jgi:hypothetical protein